jgi:hypothetical protein
MVADVGSEVAEHRWAIATDSQAAGPATRHGDVVQTGSARCGLDVYPTKEVEGAWCEPLVEGVRKGHSDAILGVCRGVCSGSEVSGGNIERRGCIDRVRHVVIAHLRPLAKGGEELVLLLLRFHRGRGVGLWSHVPAAAKGASATTVGAVASATTVGAVAAPGHSAVAPEAAATVAQSSAVRSVATQRHRGPCGRALRCRESFVGLLLPGRVAHLRELVHARPKTVESRNARVCFGPTRGSLRRSTCRGRRHRRLRMTWRRRASGHHRHNQQAANARDSRTQRHCSRKHRARSMPACSSAAFV